MIILYVLVISYVYKLYNVFDLIYFFIVRKIFKGFYNFLKFVDIRFLIIKFIFIKLFFVL